MLKSIFFFVFSELGIGIASAISGIFGNGGINTNVISYTVPIGTG